MASGLRFISLNPTSEAIRDGERRSEQRRAADMQQRRQERDFQWESNVDAALRGAGEPQPQAEPAASAPQPGIGMDAHAQGNLQAELQQRGMQAAPQPAPQPQGATQAAAQRLNRTPGGGRMSLQLQQQADQKREQKITNVIHLLSNPQTAHLGMAEAQRIGMTFPPELASNTNFWQGTAIAKQLYPDDPGAAQRFTSAFVQTQSPDVQGRVQAAIQSAGAPVKKRRYGVAQGDSGIVFYNVENPAEQIPGPQRTTGQYVTAEGGGMHFLPTGSTQAQAVTGPDGQPLKAQRFGARVGAGNTSVYEQKRQAWLSLHPGDEAGALSYASGKTVLNDVQLQNMASQMAAREFQGAFGVRPEQKQNRAQEIYQQLKGINAPATPAAPVPAAPVVPSAPPAAAQTGQYPVPQTQEEYDALPSGSIYQDPDDGQPYRKP